MKLDVREWTLDWDAFLADRAPQGAPKVVVVLYDDTGCAAWSPCGGRINLPAMQRLADNGLTDSQWHTTALCSPTRSTLLPVPPSGQYTYYPGTSQVPERSAANVHGVHRLRRR
jgi:arylsulfatase A-like enzyme